MIWVHPNEIQAYNGNQWVSASVAQPGNAGYQYTIQFNGGANYTSQTVYASYAAAASACLAILTSTASQLTLT